MIVDRAIRIYLSGPISLGGMLDDHEIIERVDVFTREAARLRAAGFEVDCPTEVDPQPSWEAYMKADLPLVCRADLIGTLPDWLLSRGSVLEVYLATQLGIPVVPANEIS